MFIDGNGKKTYIPARNDELLNIHNSSMLSIWRENVDCQHVLSRHAILTYISKYASKAKNIYESYCEILSRIAHAAPAEEAIVLPIRKLLSETVADRDIGAQETCHMLQKLPLTICSQSFVSLNVSHIVFKRVSPDLSNTPPPPTFIVAYMQIPPSLEQFPLVEDARS